MAVVRPLISRWYWWKCILRALVPSRQLTGPCCYTPTVGRSVLWQHPFSWASCLARDMLRATVKAGLTPSSRSGLCPHLTMTISHRAHWAWTRCLCLKIMLNLCDKTKWKKYQELIFFSTVGNSILLDNTKQRSLQSCCRALGLTGQQTTNNDLIVLYKQLERL